MINIRALLQITAVIALVFGVSPPDTDLNTEPFPVPHDPTLIASHESPNKHSQSQFRQIEIGITAPYTALQRN